MAEKKEPIAKMITNLCSNVAKGMEINFVLRDRKISYPEVFSDHGLLPAICKRADQLSSLCFSYGLGVDFKDEKKSMLGIMVTFDDSTPLIIRAVCIIDVICELYYSAPSRKITLVDELLYD